MSFKTNSIKKKKKWFTCHKNIMLYKAVNEVDD